MFKPFQAFLLFKNLYYIFCRFEMGTYKSFGYDFYSISPNSHVHKPVNILKDEFNDDPYSTINEDEAAYQTIQQRD